MPGELAPLRTNVSQERRHNKGAAKASSSSSLPCSLGLLPDLPQGPVFPSQPWHLDGVEETCARTIPAQSLHGATSGSTIQGCTGHLSSRLQLLLPAATGTEVMAVIPMGMSGYPREATAKESSGRRVHRMFRL